jgi:methionine-rich copper-binding protein CopC
MTRRIPDAALKVDSMVWRLLVLLILLGATPRAALAHAIIVDSSPAVNATVAAPELDVTLRFNSRIDRARSSISLSRVGASPGASPGAKPATLPIQPADGPELLKAHAAGLTPGSYNLRWQVLSVDGHITRGDIPFKVAP